MVAGAGRRRLSDSDLRGTSPGEDGAFLAATGLTLDLVQNGLQAAAVVVRAARHREQRCLGRGSSGRQLLQFL